MADVATVVAVIALVLAGVGVLAAAISSAVGVFSFSLAGIGAAAQVAAFEVTPFVAGMVGVTAYRGRSGGGPDKGWVRVTRFMSNEEAAEWEGRASVLPPRPESGNPARTWIMPFGSAKSGAEVPGVDPLRNPVRVDFDVPEGALQNAGTGKAIFGGRYVPIRNMSVGK